MGKCAAGDERLTSRQDRGGVVRTVSWDAARESMVAPRWLWNAG